MNRKQKEAAVKAALAKPFEVGDSVRIMSPEGKDSIGPCKIVGIDNGIATLNGKGASVSQGQNWLNDVKSGGGYQMYLAPLERLQHSTFNVGANPFVDTWRSRAQPALYTLDSIVGMTERSRGNLLEFDPHVIGSDGQPHYYQRGSVWSTAQKRDLIQTIYEGGDIGTIVLHQTEDYFYNVVDGKQRLMTLLDFRLDKFTDHYGNYYSGLSNMAQRTFDGCRTTTLMLQPSATAADILAAFLSINDRGTKVSKSHIEKVRSIPV